MLEPSKSDWKLFREKIADWQERYMDRLTRQYAEDLLRDLPASTRFWELEERIYRDKKTIGVQIRLRKSTMYWDIAQLLEDGVITMDDLAEFSEDVKAWAEKICMRLEESGEK